MENKTGWSDSLIRPKNSKIHFYKDGVSLCGRSVVDKGNKTFETSKKDKSDVFSGFCKICIEKQS